MSAAPALPGSAQPLVMMLSLMSSLSVQGSETSQTVRFAASASEATRTRTVAAPER